MTILSMSNRLIRKVGKQALLFITNLFSVALLGQSDSAELKKELLKLLNKHGYSSFQINLNSFDQKGGQTAFIINNNYHSDPNYLPDSLNFGFELIGKRSDTLLIYPKHSVWNQMFVLYPEEFLNQDIKEFLKFKSDPGLELAFDGAGFIIYRGNSHSSKCKVIRNGNCSNKNKAYVLIPNTKCFFVFGDDLESGDRNRWYVYDYGKISWFNSNKNFK